MESRWQVDSRSTVQTPPPPRRQGHSGRIVRLQPVAVTVERVTPQETFPLRQRVLRPGRALDRILLPGEDSPIAANFVVRDAGTREVISTGSAWPEPPPWVAGSPTYEEHAGHPPYEVPALARELTGDAGSRCWRLRGMATAEEHRGEGLGRSVLEAIVAHVAAEDGTLIWCTARIRAIPFYERAGFAGLGELFDEAEFGPHLVLWKPLGKEHA
jgi:GNAT superfamily N-acetyltransferase